ncbi:effector-associated constant component EACC1 [Nonomuraea ceibae]|uniref:effector-associated constant component EACC1 n=1 Tax=Nonomuraea ceibae TaxID=1935170 RepID=UPI001C5D4EB7|nr:hypothetical protein [Nonomuraea ceibae]
MRVEVRVVPTGELVSLTRWLRSQRPLQGRIDPVGRPPGREELGGAVELLSIAVGSGGAGMVLARALTTWLTNRHADVSITLTTPERTVTVEAKRVGDALPLLQEVLDQADRASAGDAG